MEAAHSTGKMSSATSPSASDTGSTASEPMTPARLSSRLVPKSCSPSASTPTAALK